MKKKLLTMVTVCVIAASSFAAITTVMSTWIKVSDPNCNRCIINDTTRKCGIDGGFMAQVDGTGSYEGDYLKYDYRCKKCGHTVTYKNK